MTNAKNTARRPNIHWYGSDLIAEGFFGPLIEHGAEGMILGLYLPEDYLRARADHLNGEISDDALAKVVAKHPPELTWRMDDDARTLCGSYDQSHTCPPDCS